MLKILKEAENQKKARRGKPNATLIEEKLLMTLEYWRAAMEYEVVLIDATETPIERPKKFKEKETD